MWLLIISVGCGLDTGACAISINIILSHALLLMSNIITFRDHLSVIDLKCSIVNDSQCWFCEDLCDFCLEKPTNIASVTSSIGTDNKTTELLFCSETCNTIFSTNPNQQLYALLPNKRVYSTECVNSELSAEVLHSRFGSHCVPILPSHEEIMHLYSINTKNNHSILLEEISLCYGDFTTQKDLYVVYFRRTLQGPSLCLEFFVTQECVPTDLLPYYDTCDDAAIMAFDEFKQTSDIQLQLATGMNISNTSLN